jgi:hypothetical protein
VRIVLATTDPVQEIAAEPATLARFAAVLDRARRAPTPGGVLSGGRGLLGLPLIPDPTIPPLTVLLRPYSTAPMGTTP